MGTRGNGRRTRRRLLAAVGGLLAVTATAAAPAVGRAADPGVDLRIVDGWTGTVDGGSWLPVNVVLHNRGHDLRGRVVLTAQGANGTSQQCFANGGGMVCRSFGNSMDQSGSYADYSVPVALASGVTKTVTFTILAGGSAVDVRLLDDGGGQVASAHHELDVSFGGDRTLVAVVSGDAGALDTLATVGTGTQSVQVVHLRPGDLPAQSVPLSSFDAVVLDRAPTDTLSAAQRQALADYVGGGGALIVMGGTDARATLAGLPPGLVPVTVEGAAGVHGMPQFSAMTGAPALDATVPAVRVQPHGAVALREGGLPLLTLARHGLGQVAFVAVDAGAAPLTSWGGDATFLRHVLMRTVIAPGTTPRLLNSFIRGPQSTASRATLADEMGPVGQAVALIPGITLPDGAVLGLMLLGYILLAGPVSYFVLRRLRRRDLMWVAVPALAVATAGLAYATGLGTSGRGLTLEEVRVLHLQPGSDRATVDAFVDVFSPHGGTSRLRLGGSPYVTSLANGSNANQLTAFPQDDPAAVELRSDAASLSGYSSTRSAQVHGTVDADLRDDGTTTTGTVTNHLDVDLVDAYVVTPGGQSTSIGTLARGHSTHVHADHSSGNGFNGGFSSSFREPVMGMGSGQRREYQRQQVVSALESSGLLAGQGRPVLVALASDPLLGGDVSGDNVDATVLDAVVVPLAADASGSVNGLPATLVASGDESNDDASWAVYQATLPPAGGWRNLSLTVDASCSASGPCIMNGGAISVPAIPPIVPVPVPATPLAVPGFGGASGSGSASGSFSAIVPAPVPSKIAGPSAGVTVQVYDLRTHRWVTVGTATGTQQLALDNPGDRVDSDGNIWVRLVGVGSSPPQSVRISGDPVGGRS